MDLNGETILDFYTYKTRKVLCKIKVNAESGKFKNCRSLSLEQWMVFDKELEKLIVTIDDWNNEKCLKFYIKPFILVKVQKSNLSPKHFCEWLGMMVESAKWPDAAIPSSDNSIYVLECIFNFQQEISVSIESQESEPHHGYKFDDLSRSPMSYEPYTPSKKTNKKDKFDTTKTPGIDFLESGFLESPLSTETIPKHEREPTKATGHISDSIQSDYLSKVLIESENKIETQLNDDEITSPINDISLGIKSNQLCKRMESPEYSASKEAKQESLFQADSPRNQNELSNSEDFLLKCYDENNKDKRRSEKKKPRRDENGSHCDKKGRRKLPKTTDELPAELPDNVEKILLKNKMENIVEKPYKKIEHRDKIVSFHKKEKRHEKVCTSEEKNILRKHHKISLSEDESKASHTKKLKEPLRTPPVFGNCSGDSTTEISPRKITNERNSKSYRVDHKKSLRRSERSPSKPKRFIGELPELSTKSKTHKSSHKTKELFPSDDDENGLFEANKVGMKYNDKSVKTSKFETPASKKSVHSLSSSSSTSTKKKRKRDKSSECQQEKHDINKWLSKKKATTSDHEKEKKASSNVRKKSLFSKPLPLKPSTKPKPRVVDSDSEIRSESVTSSPMTIELPSKEELELIRNKTKIMQEENARVRAELEKMRISPPKEVEILSLQNIPVNDILNTFVTYKSELDEIYLNNRKRDYIKGHDGINHCFIIRLLQQNIQMKMLQKLTEVYSNSNTTTQATLFANALLPEWVIRVYMEKFSFTRQQAIDQIKAQEAFQLHMEEQNENSFVFD